MRSFVMALFFVASLSARAEAPKSAGATAKVRGMVCGFCAQGLKKKFRAEAAVEDIVVDLEKKEVSVRFKPGQELADAKIKQLIEDAGFHVESVAR